MSANEKITRFFKVGNYDNAATDIVSSSVYDLSKRWWKKVLDKVNKAVVFADSATADCINWFCNENGEDITAFFKAGALNVKELSTFESGSPNEKKCMFIISSPLVGMALDAVRTTIQASSFEHCILVTPFSAGVHTFAKASKVSATRDDEEAFYFLEDCLLQWMGNMSYTVEVFHIPISMLPFTRSFFVTPPLCDLYSLTYSQLDKDSKERGMDSTKQNEIEFNNLLKKNQVQVKMLCDILNSMFEGLNMREDIYTVGNFSKVVAKELESLNSAKLRRKNCNDKASLLLVDRSLDVSSAVSANTDCLMDKILRFLPNLPNAHADVMVDVSVLCDAKSSVPGRSVVRGNYGQFKNEKCRHIIESSVMNKQKQTLMDVSRAVIEALNEEEIEIDKSLLKSSKESVEKIQKLVDLFEGRKESIYKHKEILQQALAIVQALQSKKNTMASKIGNIEKILVQTLSELEPDALYYELFGIIKNRHDNGLTIEDLLLIMIFIFQDGSSLLDLDMPLGHSLQTALSEAIAEDSETRNEFIASKVGDTQQGCYEFVQQFFGYLSCLQDAFKGLKQYKSAFHIGSEIEPSSHKPILKRIMEDIFTLKKSDLIDVEYRSGGLGTMLKSGFGLFGAAAKPRPDDNPVLIVFVIGGVTALEVRQINEVVKASNSNVNVVVGGTKLIRPSDMLKFIIN